MKPLVGPSRAVGPSHFTLLIPTLVQKPHDQGFPVLLLQGGLLDRTVVESLSMYRSPGLCGSVRAAYFRAHLRRRQVQTCSVPQAVVEGCR